jgi:nucleotide-binding universal stress UspA family protein
MAVSLPIEDVASAADIMFLLLFLQVNIAMIRLRKKRPDLDRGFFVPLYPYLSIVGIAMLLFIAIYMFNYSLIAWIITIVWIAIGLLVFKFYASSREVEFIRKVKALESIEKKQYSILVCLSNAKTVSSLTSVAIAMGKKHSGSRIIILSVLEAASGEKLRTRVEETDIFKPLLDEAEALVTEAGIPVRSIVKVSHRISQGIIDTAIEEHCNFIVIGRQKKPTFFDRVFSSLIDTVLQKAPSEAVVLHGDFKFDKIKNILIPFSADAHTRLATEIAPALTEFFNAKLKIAIVFNPGTPKTERDEKIKQIKQVMEENSVTALVEPVTDEDILQGILRRSRNADLVLMGGRSGDFLELLLAKSLAQEITEQVKCPVLWAKEYEERPSFWASLFKPLNQGGDHNE